MANKKDRGGAQQPHGPGLTFWLLEFGYQTSVNARLRAGVHHPFRWRRPIRCLPWTGSFRRWAHPGGCAGQL